MGEGLSRRDFLKTSVVSSAALLPNYEGFIPDTELLGHFATLLTSEEISPEYYVEQINAFNEAFYIHPLQPNVAQIKITNTLLENGNEKIIGMIATTSGQGVSGSGSIYMDRFGKENWIDIATIFIPPRAGSTLDGAIIQCSLGHLDEENYPFSRVIAEGYYRESETFQRIKVYIPNDGRMSCLLQIDERYLGNELKEDVKVLSGFNNFDWQKDLTREIDDLARPFHRLMNISY